MKKLVVLVMAILSSQVGCAQKTDNKTEMSIQNSNSIVIQQLDKFKAQDHFAGDGQLTIYRGSKSCITYEFESKSSGCCTSFYCSLSTKE